MPTSFREKLYRSEIPNTRLSRRYINSNKGDKEKRRIKILTIIEKFQESGYTAIEKNFEIFLSETTWLGHEITGHGIETNIEKIKAISKLK